MWKGANRDKPSSAEQKQKLENGHQNSLADDAYPGVRVPREPARTLADRPVRFAIWRRPTALSRTVKHLGGCTIFFFAF